MENDKDVLCEVSILLLYIDLAEQNEHTHTHTLSLSLSHTHTHTHTKAIMSVTFAYACFNKHIHLSSVCSGRITTVHDYVMLE